MNFLRTWKNEREKRNEICTRLMKIWNLIKGILSFKQLFWVGIRNDFELTSCLDIHLWVVGWHDVEARKLVFAGIEVKSQKFKLIPPSDSAKTEPGNRKYCSILIQETGQRLKPDHTKS